MRFLYVSAVLCLAGCAAAPTYAPLEGVSHAGISLSSENDTSGTLVRRIDFMVFEGICREIGEGASLGFKAGNSAKHILPNKQIPVGRSITLSAHYQDAKGISLLKDPTERHCVSTKVFEPEEGAEYSAVLRVSEKSGSCDLQISRRGSSQPVGAASPDFTCDWKGYNLRSNGKLEIEEKYIAP